MKLRALCLALALPFATAIPAAQAEPSQAIQQMAEIMLQMKTAPDKKQRELLQDLASNAPSANEQRLAKGLLSFNGNLSDDGKQEVWGVMRQISASEEERELAKIINRFEGSASPADQERLKALVPAPANNGKKAEKKTAKKSEKKADKAAEKSAKSETKK